MTPVFLMIFDCYGESDPYADILQKNRIKWEMLWNFIVFFSTYKRNNRAFYFSIYYYLFILFIVY